MAWKTHGRTQNVQPNGEQNVKQALTMRLETGHDDRRFWGLLSAPSPSNAAAALASGLSLVTTTCRYHPRAGEVRRICGKEGAGERLSVAVAGLACLGRKKPGWPRKPTVSVLEVDSFPMPGVGLSWCGRIDTARHTMLGMSPDHTTENPAPEPAGVLE